MALSVKEALEYLTASHKAHRLAHAYLICGTTGSGKEELARKFAALTLHCSEEVLSSCPPHPDFHRVQPVSKSRRIVIEQVRLLEQILRRSATRTAKIAVIQEADRFALNAANAFLKTLEEPPTGTYLILLTTNPEVVLPAILSRCIRISLRQKEKWQPTQQERSIVAHFNHCLQLSVGTVAQTFQFVRGFQTVLAECKEDASRQAAAELEHCRQHYQNRTDGTWFAERARHSKAMMESVSIHLRHGLITAVKSFLVEGLRVFHLGTTSPDPGVAFLSKVPQETLLQQIELLDRLQCFLASGVNESLALEVFFLEIFSLILRGDFESDGELTSELPLLPS
ncbi:DNA polymerase III subunit tau [Candidatus Xiphinematobacter sp. Idaho Grape]|uniref:AAA family ATPase n=1 Tax=Candidatus Xiphinematobacter sp. Idaho Grape TaxID=1704307 RepID=UPI000706D7A9|nr:AAA family ATPase [Candidatus Xiphinematobacter sp. Idaho Grape]ALJ56208.1 DNA polymerase III subunit tau [Candidatus Xiphinematobacter sp. Idaho Grape]